VPKELQVLADAEATNSNARGTDNASTFRDRIDIRVLLHPYLHTDSHFTPVSSALCASGAIDNNGLYSKIQMTKLCNVNQFSHFLKSGHRSRILVAAEYIKHVEGKMNF
jgi:hypothetical protein